MSKQGHHMVLANEEYIIQETKEVEVVRCVRNVLEYVPCCVMIIKDKIKLLLPVENKDYQLASPSDHRVNPPKWATQVVKSHFISVRACTDKSFPKNQWDLLPPHLLRPSKTNKNISACTILHGHCNFMKHPISIAGTKVVAHDQSVDRGWWDNWGTEGFINKAPEHHRNCKCFMPATNAIRTSNTVEFFPDCAEASAPNQLDTIMTVLLQLKELLQGNNTHNPQGGSAHALTQLLLDIQSPLGIPAKSHSQRTSKGAIANQTKETPIKSRDAGPTTRFQIKQVHPIGTIISEKFNGECCEGEVEEHFPREDLHKVKHRNGDNEDFTAKEISEHKKSRQACSGS